MTEIKQSFAIIGNDEKNGSSPFGKKYYDFTWNKSKKHMILLPINNKKHMILLRINNKNNLSAFHCFF